MVRPILKWVDTARPSPGCPGQAWVSPSGAGIGLSNPGDTHTETPRQVLTGARVTGTVTRTVVVAGVGPGLGSSAAREFAAQGDEVALLARSAEYLEETAADISSTEDGTALAVPTDVAESDAVEAAFETIHERFGPVDALVNNVSSTETTGGGILDATEAALEGAWEVRVAGQFRCARAAAKDMAAGEGGTILFTTSQSAVVPSESVTYSTARHAVRGMARSMAADLGEHGIQTVHAVIDGWIAKPALRERYPDHDRWMDPDEIAVTYRRLVDHPETVHASEIDLRHPGDDLSF